MAKSTCGKTISKSERKALETITSNIMEMVVVPEFKKNKIPFPANDQKKLKLSIFALLKKELIFNNEMDTYSNFLRDVSDDVIEYCIEEYLEKHRKMIPAKYSKERLDSGVKHSEQDIIFGASFYDEFEDPIKEIIEKNIDDITN